VLGIIGGNGAGKSTLLKILSRTTSPTKGEIKIKGRVASLLEVGTGFHPELSGRENIFLNGAILGMTKKEIKSKFDEIVDFAGVERYIDTPVKRYSSGMYVRLAFGVAAHLEPEILIVDEVLAVGDAEFQKKALGKMKDISGGQGRTVLFVSHNMAAIQNLCKNIVYLKNGIVEKIGETFDIVNQYLFDKKNINKSFSNIKERKGSGILKFTNGKIKNLNSDLNDIVETFSDVEIELEYELASSLSFKNKRIDIGINNLLGERVAWLSSDTLGFQPDLSKGKIKFVIRSFPLAPGTYSCTVFAQIDEIISDWITDVLEFNVAEKDYYNTGKTIPPKQGNILLNYKVEL
jgi:lipopolysaccharide transport system ATP-binding protein